MITSVPAEIRHGDREMERDSCRIEGKKGEKGKKGKKGKKERNRKFRGCLTFASYCSMGRAMGFGGAACGGMTGLLDDYILRAFSPHYPYPPQIDSHLSLYLVPRTRQAAKLAAPNSNQIKCHISSVPFYLCYSCLRPISLAADMNINRDVVNNIVGACHQSTARRK